MLLVQFLFLEQKLRPRAQRLRYKNVYSYFVQTLYVDYICTTYKPAYVVLVNTAFVLSNITYGVNTILESILIKDSAPIFIKYHFQQ
jgi:hypothetical protein